MADTLNKVTTDELFWRRTGVCAGALIYGCGVYGQGRRVRKRMGRESDVQPGDTRGRSHWDGGRDRLQRAAA